MLRDFFDIVKRKILYIINFLLTIISSLLFIGIAKDIFTPNINVIQMLIIEVVMIIATFISKNIAKNKLIKHLIVLLPIIILLIINVGNIIDSVKYLLNNPYDELSYVVLVNTIFKFIFVIIGYLFVVFKPYVVLTLTLLVNVISYMLYETFDYYYVITLIFALLFISLNNFINFNKDKTFNISNSKLLVPIIGLLISGLIAFTCVPIIQYLNPIRILDNMIDASSEIIDLITSEFGGSGGEWSDDFTGTKGDGLITNDIFIDKERIDDDILFYVDSGKKIERLKYKSYGGYDYNEHRFLDDDITDINIDYDDLFLKCDNHNNFVTITEIKENKHIFYPYGTIECEENNFHAYYDRCLEDKTLNINHYTFKHNDTKNISGNEGFDRYSQYASNSYTLVPSQLEDKLKELLINNNIDYTSENKEELIEQINSFLSNNYTYSYEIDESNKEPISRFLFETKIGYSQHFASAATLLYRCCDIPARYTVGYRVNNRHGGCRQMDAYAWVEVFDYNYGWKVQDAFIELDDSAKENINEVEDTEDQSQDSDLEKQEELNDENKETQSEAFEEEQEDSEIENESKQQEINGNSTDTDGSFEEENANGNMSSGGDGKSEGGLEGSGVFSYGYSSTITNEDISGMANVLCAVFKCTNNEVDRLRDYAYGDFNYETSTFELYEDISMCENADSIDFDSIFLNNDKKYLNHNITVNLLYNSNVALVPYSSVYGSNMNMYQDKIYRFDNNKNKYKLTYHNSENVKFNNKEYSKFVYDKYLNVPDELKEPLKDFLIEHNIDYTSSNKKKLINKIDNLMHNEFSYSLSPPELPSSENVILYFLNTSKTGYCMHFASSSTLLLRMCGIPTRYVSGYVVAGYDENNIGYCTSQTGHAWCEVYDESKGWVVVDTTSSNDIGPEFEHEEISIPEVEEPEEEEETIEEELTQEEDLQEQLQTDETIYEDENTAPKLLMIIGSIDLLITIFTLFYLYKSLRRKDKKLFGKRRYQYMNSYYSQLLNNNYKVAQASHTMKRIKYSSDTVEEEDLKEFVDYKYEYLSKKKGKRK